MVIKEVSYTDFRNMENAVIELSPGTNVLWGDNAQGKTNILEGIYFSPAARASAPLQSGSLCESAHSRPAPRSFSGGTRT